MIKLRYIVGRIPGFMRKEGRSIRRRESKRTNQEIRKEAEIPNIESLVRNRRIRLIGYISSLENNKTL